MVPSELLKEVLAQAADKELQLLDLVPVSLENSLLNCDSEKHVCICVCEYLSVCFFLGIVIHNVYSKTL